MTEKPHTPPAHVEASPHTDPDSFEATLRYLSSVAATETRLRHVESVPHGPELVRDVMTTGVVAAHEDALFKEVVDALIRNRVSAVPVIDAEGRVLGVVSESDLLLRVSQTHLALPRGHRLTGRGEERRKVHAATARELMTAPAVVTSPNAAIAEAAWIVGRSRVRRLPVVNDDGVLVGIVTRSDLLRPFLRTDDQIREDIRENVIVGAYLLDPSEFDLSVEEGVVKVRGELERRSVTIDLIDDVRGLAGVVEVVDALTYRIDDAVGPPPAAVLY